MKAKHEWSRGGEQKDYPQKCKNCDQTRWSAEDTVCVGKLKKLVEVFREIASQHGRTYEESCAYDVCANELEGLL